MITRFSILIGLIIAGITFGVASPCIAEDESRDAQSKIQIIPEPVTLEACEGLFRFTTGTQVVASGRARVEADKLIDDLAPAMGYRLRLAKDASTGENVIRLEIKPALKDKAGEEGYELTVTKQSIVIRAFKPAGLYYGIQTLRQLLPPVVFGSQKADGVEWTVPCVRITDRPR